MTTRSAPISKQPLPERLRQRLGSADGFDPRLFAPLISGAVLNPVNSSIIAVALVPIGVAFGEPASATAWLISSLYLATAVGQPVVGRLIDMYGPRRLFLPATALVGLAGVVGTLAPNLAVLILARVILGFGTCAGYPAAMRLIRDESERTGHDSPAFVLTVLAVSTQTIAVIGPSLGGLLIGLGGWRTTFAVNIPVALLAFALGARRLPKPTRPTGAGSRSNPQRPLDLDLLGTGLFAGTLVALLLFLMHPRVEDWYLVLIAAAGATGFTVREISHANPFIDLRILGRNAPLLITYGRALLAYVVSYSFVYGYTQWLEDGRGLSASQAGLATLPLFATGVVVSLVSGRRTEVRGKLVVAAIGQIVGCVLLLTLHPSTAVWLLIVVALVFGIPQGLNSLALQNSVYRQANPDDIGASAGLLRTFGYLGAIVSSAAQGAFYGHAADTRGMHHLAMLLVGIGVAFLLITVFDRSLTTSTIGSPRRQA
jgi:MFS family permease